MPRPATKQSEQKLRKTVDTDIFIQIKEQKERRMKCLCAQIPRYKTAILVKNNRIQSISNLLLYIFNMFIICFLSASRFYKILRKKRRYRFRFPEIPANEKKTYRIGGVLHGKKTESAQPRKKKSRRRSLQTNAQNGDFPPEEIKNLAVVYMALLYTGGHSCGTCREFPLHVMGIGFRQHCKTHGIRLLRNTYRQGKKCRIYLFRGIARKTAHLYLCKRKSEENMNTLI